MNEPDPPPELLVELLLAAPLSVPAPLAGCRQPVTVT